MTTGSMTSGSGLETRDGFVNRGASYFGMESMTATAADRAHAA